MYEWNVYVEWQIYYELLLANTGMHAMLKRRRGNVVYSVP